MRAGVEAGRFERFPGLPEQLARCSRDRNVAPAHPAVHVEHPEADTLHVKRFDGPGQRPALVDQRREGAARHGFERW